MSESPFARREAGGRCQTLGGREAVVAEHRAVTDGVILTGHEARQDAVLRTLGAPGRGVGPVLAMVAEGGRKDELLTELVPGVQEVAAVPFRLVGRQVVLQHVGPVLVGVPRIAVEHGDADPVRVAAHEFDGDAGARVGAEQGAPLDVERVQRFRQRLGEIRNLGFWMIQQVRKAVARRVECDRGEVPRETSNEGREPGGMARGGMQHDDGRPGACPPVVHGPSAHIHEMAPNGGLTHGPSLPCFYAVLLVPFCGRRLASDHGSGNWGPTVAPAQQPTQEIFTAYRISTYPC